MFKYIVIFTLIFTIIFSLAGCMFDSKKASNTTTITQNSFQQNLPEGLMISSEWNLIVFKEKKEIPIILSETDNIVFKCVPLLSLLEEIGVCVLYDKNNIELRYNNETLYVDLSKEIIHAKDSEFNVLDFPVGGEVYYRFIDYDIVSCGPSFTAVCHFLGLDLSYVISEKNKTIEIDWLKNQSGNG